MEGLEVMRTLIVLALGATLAACGGERPVVEKPVITYVEKRVECPSAAERARLQALRPDPLRNQTMPATGVERSAKAQAQLGIYEAEGGYADQVDAALNRCQTK